MDQKGKVDRLLMSVAPQTLQVHDSQILEIAAKTMAQEGAIRLYAGESDEPTPGFILDAARQAMEAGHTRYTLSQGVPACRDEIAAYYRRIYQKPVEADRITVTVGGMQALSQTLLALCEPGDEVLIPVPVWPNILEATKIARGVPVTVPMSFDERRGWQLDLNLLIEAITPKTKIVFINSPANPTGWMMSRDEMQVVLDVCRARGLWLISDEVYGRLVYDGTGKAPSMIDLIDPHDQVVICNTLSKNWSMTGWRLGWALAPAALGSVYDNLMQYGSTGATTFVQHAAIAALRDGDDHVQRMGEQCQIGRDIVCDAFASLPGVRFVPPQGAFYLFFSLAGMTDSRAVAFDILDKAGIGLAPGAAFSPQGEGWMRLCFGVSHPTLREAVARLSDYIGERY